jgi:hypothetical protein
MFFAFGNLNLSIEGSKRLAGDMTTEQCFRWGRSLSVLKKWIKGDHGLWGFEGILAVEIHVLAGYERRIILSNYRCIIG